MLKEAAVNMESPKKARLKVTINTNYEKNALEMLKIYCSKFVLKMLAQQTTYDSRGVQRGVR